MTDREKWKHRIMKILAHVWPPIELWGANRRLERQMSQLSDEGCFKEASTRWATSTSQNDLAEFASEVEKIQAREDRRRDRVESKAASLTGSLGVSLALVGVVVAVVSGQWGIAGPFASITAILLALAVVYLLASVYYAIKVTTAGMVIAPTTDLIASWTSSKYPVHNRVADKLASIELNVPAVLVKTNYLYVAQILFRRGILMFIIGVVVALGTRLVIGSGAKFASGIDDAKRAVSEIEASTDAITKEIQQAEESVERTREIMGEIGQNKARADEAARRAEIARIAAEDAAKAAEQARAEAEIAAKDVMKAKKSPELKRHGPGNSKAP